MIARAAVLRRPVGWILAGVILSLLGAIARAGEDEARIQRLQAGVDERARSLEAIHGEGSPVARRLVAELLARIRREHGVSLRDPMARSEMQKPIATADAARVRRRFDELRTAAERRWGKGAAPTRRYLALAKGVLERRHGVELAPLPELTVAERSLLCQRNLERVRAHLEAGALSTEMRARCLRQLRSRCETSYEIRLTASSDEASRPPASTEGATGK